MIRRRQLFTAVLLTLFVIPVRAQETASKKDPALAPKADASETVPQSATNDPNYILGPQDVVNVNVWKEPELSRTVPVRPDGKISLPLINDVQASGLTPSQLAAEISQGLKKFEADPEVTVIVTTMKGQRFYVLGEAGHPGAFELLPNMTLLQAISSAGGFTLFAHPKRIYLLRQENGKPVKYPFDYKAVLAGKKPEQNIVLKPGDTIVVP